MMAEEEGLGENSEEKEKKGIQENKGEEEEE